MNPACFIENINFFSNFISINSLSIKSFGFYNVGNFSISSELHRNYYMAFIQHPLVLWKLNISNGLHYNLITNMTHGSSQLISGIVCENNRIIYNMNGIMKSIYYCDNPMMVIEDKVLNNNFFIKDEIKTNFYLNNGKFKYLNSYEGQQTLKKITFNNILNFKQDKIYYLHDYKSNIDKVSVELFFKKK